MLNQFPQFIHISISSEIIKTALYRHIYVVKSTHCNPNIHFPFYQPTCQESAMMLTICIYLAENSDETLSVLGVYSQKHWNYWNIETDASNLSKSAILEEKLKINCDKFSAICPSDV